MQSNTQTPDVYNVETFCNAHDISRSLFYDLLGAGIGPELTKIGKRTLIDRDDAQEWRKHIKTVDVDSVLKEYRERKAQERKDAAA